MADKNQAFRSGQPRALIVEPRRILIRGVNWLGDAVMSTPALQRLRERFPNAHIAMLTQENLAGLWKYQPSINSVIPFSPGESIFSIGRRLRGEKFDTALVFPNSPRSALEVWLAGIGQRIGYRRSWRNWFLTHAVPARLEHRTMNKRSTREVRHLASSKGGGARAISPTAHQIHDFLQLAAALGSNPLPMAPFLRVTDVELASTAKRFGLAPDRPSRSHPLFGLNAGAEYGPAKRWPRERFVAAAAELQKRTKCCWLIFGGKANVDLALEIATSLETLHRKLISAGELPAPLNLAGKTTLQELCSLIKLCDVFLTNDTGPMHVAAAVGTPVVVPFGSTSPELTGPGLPGDPRHRLLKSDAPCSPCFRRTCPIDFRCMTGITVENVVEAVIQAVSVPKKASEDSRPA